MNNLKNQYMYLINLFQKINTPTFQRQQQYHINNLTYNQSNNIKATTFTRKKHRFFNKYNFPMTWAKKNIFLTALRCFI